jgi:PAS domain S-box-containing protein
MRGGSDESKFRLLASTAAEGIVCSSPEGIVTFANPAAASILGWESPEAMVGRPSTDLYHDSADRGTVMRRLELEDRLDPVDLTMCSQEGRPVQTRGSVTRVFDDQGRFVEFLGVITSTRELLAEREKLDEVRFRLQRSAADLEESQRDLDEFAHVVSHDLREPVRMVGSFLELLRSRAGEALDERAHEYLGFASEGAGRLDAQIAALLEYARVRTRGEAFDRREGEDLLRLAEARVASAVARTGATITHDPLPAVHGDRAQLVALLGHLLDNALKFREGERAPQIHLRSEKAGDRQLIEVQDDGIGLEPRFKDQVFEMFARLNTREEYPGNGAGLAICRRIVGRHGGEIWIRSQPAQGTRVFFTLPAAVDD